jgi:phosphoglycerol transferase
MAISLIVFGLLVTRATRRWRPWVQALLAVLILPFAAYEQVLPRRAAAEVDALHQQASADAALVAVMQARLPRGSRVFQLPAVDYPEVSFEPFRPFLWSDGLSFSFGNMKGRPEAEWQHRVAALPPAEMLAALDEAGFKAIFLLENGKELAGALTAIRPVEFHESTGSNASLILLSEPTSK